MIALTIDGKRVEVEEGTTVLSAAERLGIRIPRFCYHKCLSVVGSCRLCFVEIEGVKNPVVSCKEAAREGMVVQTNSELARRARADTLEFLLKNHPLDCPVCDQSGECDL
ncbi:MAG TPA: 2Fe-2S iron-sulfur cluster-binding protein, partial [bacterium]|nr:2Fe-2S iron-sulfur cluster-binding protein [bacterium]